ncbi:MAG: GNAT family N-acetyltransferase [Candidatus Bathyarchaeota archaeon]|nr:GNAT family N-acetyltransferase [Candidatus Bathyarchaeota archaeon]
MVAFGYAMATEALGHVTWIGTRAEWRNRGYATSILSTLLRECLLKAPEVVIYVAEDNATAKNVYLKAGFRPCHEYIFVRV